MDDPITTDEAAAILGKDRRTLMQWRENGEGPKYERTDDGRIVNSRWIVEWSGFGPIPKGEAAAAACDRLSHSDAGLKFIRDALAKFPLKTMPAVRGTAVPEVNQHSRMFSPPDSPYSDEN